MKHATSADHLRLDRIVDAAGFFDRRCAYVAYLKATLRARQALEADLDAARADLIFAPWPQRKLRQVLGADLHDLTGLDPTLASADVAPPAPLSPPQVLGTLYVLEGSALGARILGRRAAMIGMSPTCGGRHLSDQTAMPTAWRTLVDALDAASLDADEERACIAAARATFARFELSYAQV